MSAPPPGAYPKPPLIRGPDQATYNPLARTIAFARSMQQESVIVPIYKQTMGEFPEPSFQELTNIVGHDQDIMTSVAFIRNSALARGFKAKCNGDVSNYYRTEAEDFLEDWLDAVRWGDSVNERGFKIVAKDLFFELVGIGTSMVEKVTDERGRIVALAHVQASSIWRYQRDEYGNLVYIWQLPFYDPRPLTPSRYIVYTWNKMNREPFGRGLVHPLAQWRTGADGTPIWPPVYRWWQMQDSVARKLQRYGNPHSIFSVKGIGREESKGIAEYLKDPQADSSYITDYDVGVATDSPTAGRMNLGPDLDWWTHRFQAGLGTAIVKLLTESDNNRAGSQVKQQLEDILMWDAKDSFANTTDLELLGPVLDQNGYDSALLKPHLTYNLPEDPEEYTFADLIKAATPDPTTGKALISAEEFRKNARSWGWELDDDPQTVTMPGNLPTPVNGLPQQQQQPLPPQNQALPVWKPEAPVPTYQAVTSRGSSPSWGDERQ